MNIILFGFRKCGKTYFGMKLAQKLHKEFIESDHLLEEMYTAHYHQTLSYREIAKKHGFEFFRALEKHVVSLLLQKNNYVLSLGGGVILDPENVSRLRQVGILIYLKAPEALLKSKILSGDIPHYFDQEHPGESFDCFYKDREPVYAAAATHQINTENKTEAEILQEICQLVKIK